MTDEQQLDMAQQGACMNLQVLRASHFVLKAFDEAYREFGVRATQLPVLAMMAENPSPVSIKEIAEVVESERSVMFRKLKVMEKNGWIVEDQAITGKEKMYLLTDSGRKLIDDLGPIRAQVQEKLMTRLAPDEQHLLMSLCGKLRGVA
ncbi:MAG: hypothetical protein OEX03_10275 [Gammaproteobacteria bacterium]|nr:hypothetical protein [Gammaproteobacteria bacterium]